MSLNEIIKQFQIVAKGHNVTYEIVNPMNHTIAATDVTSGHVPENGGTCQPIFATVTAKQYLDCIRISPPCSWQTMVVTAIDSKKSNLRMILQLDHC
jgi:hypothetical protein